VLIGQNIGLRWLIPLALERLIEDPLAEGDFFPGDLLCAVLRADEDYWRANPRLHSTVASIAEKALSLAAERGDNKVVCEALEEAMARYPPQSA